MSQWWPGHPRSRERRFLAVGLKGMMREGILALIRGGSGIIDIEAVASLHLGQRHHRSRGRCREFEI
jgi:hypothetical protein